MLSRPTCAKLVLLCNKSAADNLHSKTKAEPLAEFSASVSTYLQGNSRVDKPFRMEDKTRAIISGAGERGNPRDTSPPPWRGRFCSFGFPDRSEERRVGKECRSGWSPDHEKKKMEA